MTACTSGLVQKNERMTYQRNLLRPIILKCRQAQAKAEKVGGSVKYRPPRDDLRVMHCVSFLSRHGGKVLEIFIKRET